MKSLIQNALPTSTSEYVIDMEKGQILHSQAMTKDQTLKYYRFQPNINRPDLNARQAKVFGLKYALGQRYLEYVKAMHYSEVQRLTYGSSLAFIKNNMKIFIPVHFSLAFPVVQLGWPGFVREAQHREQIVNYMNKLIDKQVTFGTLGRNAQSKKQNVAKLAQNYRKILFSKKTSSQKAAPQQ